MTPPIDYQGDGMMLAIWWSMPRTIRLRYLVKDADVYSATTGQIHPGEWHRVWSRTWKEFRGAKKVMSGKTTIVALAAMRGWE